MGAGCAARRLEVKGAGRALFVWAALGARSPQTTTSAPGATCHSRWPPPADLPTSSRDLGLSPRSRARTSESSRLCARDDKTGARFIDLVRPARRWKNEMQRLAAGARTVRGRPSGAGPPSAPGQGLAVAGISCKLGRRRHIEPLAGGQLAAGAPVATNRRADTTPAPCSPGP